MPCFFHSLLLNFTFQYEKINTQVGSAQVDSAQVFTFQYEKINTMTSNTYTGRIRAFTFQYEKINT